MSIFLFSILYTKNNIVHAHSLFPGNFATINNEDVLTANTSPEPLSLEWSEHISLKNYQVDQQLKIKANIEGYRSVFKYSDNDIDYIWKLPDGTEQKGDEAIFTSDKTGTFIIYFRVFDKSKNSVLWDEDFSFNIGENASKVDLIVNGEKIDKSAHPAYRTIKIDRFIDNTFEISNPNSNYSYNWDFPDGETYTDLKVTRKFENTKIPSYIIVRATDKNTNVYDDTYIRLESDQEQKNVVQRPPAPSNLPAITEENTVNPAIIVIPISIVLMILIFAFYRWRKSTM